MVQEASITLPVSPPDTVRKDMSPFYNPAMRTNRDVTLGVLDAVDEEVDAYFPLSGTGIRALRLLKETGAASSVAVNDINQHFPDRFRRYADQNGVSLDDVSISQDDARRHAYDLRSYDFVEIDPFGSPNPFLDSCVQELRDDGIIAVTATDTAPLSGTYPSTCQRKYWAEPRRSYEMHEFALRILIRKCQLVASQHDRALTPLVSYASKHYFKVVLRCEKSKETCHDLQGRHGFIRRDNDQVGPLWTGRLQDPGLIGEALRSDAVLADESVALLETLRAEGNVGATGFFDVHEAASATGVGAPPGIHDVLRGLREKGFEAARTHLAETGVRTSASRTVFRDVIRNG